MVTLVEAPFSHARMHCYSLLDFIMPWAQYTMTTRVFPRRLTGGEIFKNRLLFMNNRLFFPYCFLEIFVGGTRPCWRGDKVVIALCSWGSGDAVKHPAGPGGKKIWHLNEKNTAEKLSFMVSHFLLQDEKKKSSL